MAKAIDLRVVSPEKVVFDGPARSVLATAWDGQVGILPNHAPFLTILGSGPLAVEAEAGGRREFVVSGGVMRVESNMVTVLAEAVTEGT